MLDLAAAAARVMAALVPVDAEEIALVGAAGRVLAADVQSQVALPLWPNSAMDGYALRGADVADASPTAPVELRVVGTVAAGGRARRALGSGEAMRIMTGAPLPDGADCVIRIEDTDRGTDKVRVGSTRDVGRNVRPAGEDVAAGSVVATRGTWINPGLLALLAAVGCTKPRVSRRPVIAVVGSGDELTTIERFADVRSGERIVATNGYALGAIIRDAGGEVLDLGVARDDREALRALMTDGAARADLLVTTAGVSVGEHDYTRQIVEETGAIDFWRISARPGSQLAFGTLGGTPWLGLPGNPVSAAITGELFVRPAVLRLQGVERVHRAAVQVRLAAPVQCAPAMTLLLRATLARSDGGFVATLTGPQGSGLMSSVARADALLVIPAGEEVLAAGSRVAALPLHGAVVMENELRVTSPEAG